MRVALLAAAFVSLVACEPTVRFDYLNGVRFVDRPVPESCVPGFQASSETVPGVPPTNDPGDPGDDTDGSCDAPLITRTQGFWKNHPCVIAGDVGGKVLLPVTVGAGVVFETPAEVTGYLETPPKGGNAQIILGHQLVAAKQNVAAFEIGRYVFADVNGDGILETVDELVALGDAAFDSGDSWDRLRMAAVLDRLNNAGDDRSLAFEPGCGGASEQ
jgi:hypothetical protein